jgi:hypothetical protein
MTCTGKRMPIDRGWLNASNERGDLPWRLRQADAAGMFQRSRLESERWMRWSRYRHLGVE